jgi:hypothetical protein
VEALRKGVHGPTRTLLCRLDVVAFSVITAPHPATSVAACAHGCTMGHMCHNRFANAQDVGVPQIKVKVNNSEGDWHRYSVP